MSQYPPNPNYNPYGQNPSDPNYNQGTAYNSHLLKRVIIDEYTLR